jgi:C4-dicarboxylate transporter DctM subunit
MGLTDCSKAVGPWLLTMLVFLMIITYVPEVSIWLPKYLGMM